METKTCLDCGMSYTYDKKMPLGASTAHCARCRKRSTQRNKKVALFNIATNNSIHECVKCGYKRCLEALHLIDTINHISKPDPEVAAKGQFILCSNCKTELDEDIISFEKVPNTYPVQVKLFEAQVAVVCKHIQIKTQPVKTMVDAEIVDVVPINIKEKKQRVNKICKPKTKRARKSSKKPTKES